MPQQRPNIVTVRVTPNGYKSIDDLAHEYRMSRSQVARAMLAVSLTHEPEIRKILEQWTAA